MSLRIDPESTSAVRIAAAPRVLTLDGEPARLRAQTTLLRAVVGAQGRELREVPSSIEMVLTPQVRVDGTVAMHITLARDEPARSEHGRLRMEERNADIRVRVGDGERFVVEGIESTYREERSAVPFVGPLLDRRTADERPQLLVFVTPRIVNRVELGL